MLTLVEQSILWHLANGYNAMIITDHNEIEPAFAAQTLARQKYSDKMKVLVGQEFVSTTC